MIEYRRYVSYLDSLLSSCEWGNNLDNGSNLHFDLNGGAAQALRAQVKEEKIKAFGAFFTGEKLGRDALSAVAQLSPMQPVFDPACGAGDLLLRWAEHLPVSHSLEKTIDHWQTLIYGSDIHQEFVDVAKRRLILLAISKGAKIVGQNIHIDNTFSGIIQQDFLKGDSLVPNATIVLNPPFNQISQFTSTWGNGRTSQAAAFVAKCIEEGHEGKHVIAILPDVLRSGSRYKKWRMFVEKNLVSTQVTSVGRFNNLVDVDVFILSGIITKKKNSFIKWGNLHSSGEATLDTLCTIKVGSVVPHRDPLRGPWVPYFSVHDLPPWKHVNVGPLRQVSSSTLQPPFVVVRRTSSPSDKQRPVASIISMNVPVALENHLIALIPKDGRLKTCEIIMQVLQRASTRDFLDNEIRCRHLTVQVLKQIKAH